MIGSMRRFAATESAGGVVLALAALAALAASNSPLGTLYQQLLAWSPGGHLGVDLPVSDKPVLWWVNDFWMAIFFLLVGLEIKREVLVGQLASLKQASLPLAAAFGGMLVPALIYAGVNHADPVALRGWAIPMATDIAFALGVLALLGPRVPVSLKVFVTAVAVIDDLGAIAVIAAFYTSALALPWLAAAGGGALLLLGLNRARVASVGAYALVGLAVWTCVLKSGIHPTLAGVLTAAAIPLRDRAGDSPLRRAEQALHPWVAFAVLPVFAFCNAGVDLRGLSLASVVQPVPLGIGLGLLLGKLTGVAGASWLLLRATGGRLPAQANGRQFAGVCMLCGIGFTMSLFIGGLAFAGLPGDHETQVKLGVIGASLLAGVGGTVLLLAGRAQAA